MTSQLPPPSLVHIVRHGESLLNVERGYPFRDPPLTQAGSEATKEIGLPSRPDVVVISPMTRTCQTAMNMFPVLQDMTHSPIPTQIWPDLREANDAICNKGLARADIQAKFPQFDVSECEENWSYASDNVADATERAERVRRRLLDLSATFKNIAVISDRGCIAYLVPGQRFEPAESRSY
jgi:broad specificity phosphatase PhoE